MQNSKIPNSTTTQPEMMQNPKNQLHNNPTRDDAKSQNPIPQQPTPNPTQPKTDKNKMEQKQKTKGNQSPGSKKTKGRELKAHQKERKPTKAWIFNEYGSFDHLQCELFFLQTCMWTQSSGKGRERPKKKTSFGSPNPQNFFFFFFANDDNGDDYDANLLRKKSKRDAAGKDFPRARERERERRA